jgi:penicillin amidase
MGRNNELAWSLTSNEADIQDVVKVDRDDITSRVTEVINIDGEFNENLIVSFFHNAPVITGELAESGAGEGYALLSTALNSNDRSPDALLRLSMASSVDEGGEALKLFVAPFLNVHLADINGDIARVHAGVVPKRTGISGRLPLKPTDAWSENSITRVEDVVRNPSSGFVANANERTQGLDVSVSGDWPQPARAERLNSLLSQPLSFSIEDMGAIQNDVRDVTWDLWKYALEGKDFIGEEAQAHNALKNWNGEMRRDLAAPLIYASWMAEVQHQMFADELGVRMPMLPLPGPMQLAAMIKNQSAWCDDIESPIMESCDRIAENAFRATAEALTDELGSDVNDWHWGDTHVAQFRHALLGRIPFFADYYDRRIETDGGNRTLSRGATPRQASAKLGFPHVHGAGVRALHDLGGGPSRYMVGPGQSGNPFSDHYDDLLEPWRDGEYVGFDAPRQGLLRLLPANTN